MSKVAQNPVDVFFAQHNPEYRLALVRVSLAFIFLLLPLVSPPSLFYFEAAPILYKPTGLLALIPGLSPVQYKITLAIMFLSAFLFGIGYRPRLSAILLSISFFIWNGYRASFTDYFATNTHLHFFLLIFCFVPSAKFLSVFPAGPTQASRKELPSFALGWLQSYLGVIYLMAGLAKIHSSGAIWFVSGDTIFGHIALNAQYSERVPTLALLQYPWLFPALGIGTAIYEFGFLPFLLFFRSQRFLGFAGLVFHSMIHLIMSIPFFHFWILFPALFIIGNVSKKHSHLRTLN